VGVKSGRGVMLTTHPLLVPRLRKCNIYKACYAVTISISDQPQHRVLLPPTIISSRHLSQSGGAHEPIEEHTLAIKSWLVACAMMNCKQQQLWWRGEGVCDKAGISDACRAKAGSSYNFSTSVGKEWPLFVTRCVDKIY
jgi:hypothetical protein